MNPRDRRLSLSRRSFVGGSAALGAAAALPRLGAAKAAAPAVAQEGEPVELRWSMWSATQAETDVWLDLADDVTAAHPNITITLETTSFTDYWDRLTTQLASGTEADIVGMQSLRMPGFAARNALRPLQPFIDEDPDVNYEDFFDTIQQGMSHGGEVYALAYDLGPYMLFYNKELFDAAGVPYPSPTEPMTWDEFHDVATQLTDADAGQYGVVFQPNFDQFVPWLWSNGGDYMNEEETESTLDEPEAVEAIQFVADLHLEDQIAAPITDLANPQFASESFIGGNIGMHTNGPWQFVNLRAEAPFEWDIAPIPAGAAGSVTWVAGSGFGISNTTEHPEEVWQAIKVITSSESLSKLAAAGRGYPARQSSVPAFVEAAGDTPEHVDTVEQIVAEEIAQARFFRTTTTWQETVVMLQRDFSPVFIGQQTVDETVTQVKREFDELLERHQQILERG